jgi:MFS family permease
MYKSKIWTKDFVIILFTNFVIACSLYLLLVVISAYAMEQFNSTPGKAGLAASIFIIGGLVARFLTGKWIEIIGRKKTLYIGLVITVVMTLLYCRVESINYLLLIRFFHGAGWGISTVATGTIAAGILPEERCGEGIAYYTLGGTLATAIGPFMAVFMNQHWGYNGVFLFCIIGSVLTLAITFFLNIDEMILTNDQMKDSKGFKLNNFLEIKVIPISIICMLIYFCYSSVLAFFAAYVKEIGLINVASIFMFYMLLQRLFQDHL